MRVCKDARKNFKRCHIVDDMGMALCFSPVDRFSKHAYLSCSETAEVGPGHTRCYHCIRIVAALAIDPIPDSLEAA